MRVWLPTAVAGGGARFKMWRAMPPPTAARLQHAPNTLPLPLTQGHAYHAVYAPGFCWAEASNHWHAVGSAAGVSLGSWLARWQGMAAKCPDAWQTRMQHMWGFFRRLERFPSLAGPAGELLGMRSGG